MSSSILQKLAKIFSTKDSNQKEDLYKSVFINLNKHNQEIKNLQNEILMEIANSLRNNEENLRKQIEEYNDLINFYRHCKDDLEKEKIKKEIIKKQKEVVYQKWKFIVQREALGLIWTEEIDKKYNIPNFYL